MTANETKSVSQSVSLEFSYAARPRSHHRLKGRLRYADVTGLISYALIPAMCAVVCATGPRPPPALVLRACPLRCRGTAARSGASKRRKVRDCSRRYQCSVRNITMRNRAECVGEFATEYRTHTDHTVDVLTRLRYRPDVRLTHGRARRGRDRPLSHRAERLTFNGIAVEP